MIVSSLFIIGLMGLFSTTNRLHHSYSGFTHYRNYRAKNRNRKAEAILSQLLFTKEKWWSEFFELLKAVKGTLVILADNQTDVISTDSSNNLRQL